MPGIAWMDRGGVRSEVLADSPLAPSIETTDWRTLTEALSESPVECLVVSLGNPLARDFECLRRVGTAFPSLPIVLVTGRSPEVAKGIHDLRVDRLLWTEEVDRELSDAVRSLTLFGPVETTLDRAGELDPKLRAALRLAFRRRAPFLYVGRWAKEAGLDYAGLRRLWIEAAGEAASSLTLKRLLQWILVVRAAALKTPRTTWDFVAAELRVDRHTLWRTFREVTGAPPSDHEGKSSRLREAFMDRLETTLR